jgi:hypothetical protein
LYGGRAFHGGGRSYAPLVAFLVLVSAGAEAAAPKSRIRYTEPVRLETTAIPPAAMLQPDAPAEIDFDAYGRRFELELESNERLLRRLPARRRAELPPHDLYRGRLAGLPESWLRLTRLPDGLYGAIWDGSELYSIVPAHAAAVFMGGSPPRTSDQPLIYRASDVELLVGPRFCTVLDPRGGPHDPTNGLDQYKALLRELPRGTAAAEAVATRELEVAMIADFEFFSAEVDPASALLYRLNIVDGIFSEQVGVAIVASELEVFDDPADPFTTAIAPTLLDQLGSHRVSNPAIAAAGLAHLVTGRDLVGDTVGIAYLFGVCEAEIGVSLSERSFDPFFSALIAAHEFGHNFGAPHDAEPGSPCQTAPPGFLMEATLNGSQQFSQCSLDQMAPVIAQSACVRQRRFIDVEPAPRQAVISGYNRIPIRVGVDVTNHGTVAAQSVDVVLGIDGPFTVSLASSEEGTCTANANTVTCRLPDVPAGSSRRIEVDVTGERAGHFTGEVTTSTADDVNPDNDRGTFELSLLAATDASITAEAPISRSLLSGTQFEVSYLVRVDGKQGVSSASVESTAHNFTVLSASGQGASCTVAPTVAACEFGAIAVGARRRVTLTLRAGEAGPQRITHSLDATVDDTANDNTAIHEVFVQPLVDLVVRAEPAPTLVQRGERFTASFSVLSVGLREAPESSVVVQTSSELEIVNVAAQDASCVLQAPSEYRCTFAAPIPADGTRRVDVEVRAARVGRSLVHAEVFTPANQHIEGPLSTTALVVVEVRELVDVRIEDAFPTVAYDSRPFDFFRRITSSGLSPAAGATYMLQLPDGVAALSAQASLGSCTVNTGTVHCSLGTLAPGTTADVSVKLQTSRLGPIAIGLDATADNDSDATNNASTAHLTVEPNFDVGLDPPPDSFRVTIGQTDRYPITVRSASQPVEGVTVSFLILGFPQFHIQSVSSSLGSCTFVGDWAECIFGHMPANSVGVVEIELFGDGEVGSDVHVAAFCDGDVDGSNGELRHTIRVVPPSNVFVNSSAPDVRTTIGTTFAFPRVFVHATSETPDTRLTMRVPGSLSIASAIPDAGMCEVSAGTVSCEFGDLIDETRTVDLSLRAAEAGTFTTEIQVTAGEDAIPDDSSTSVDVIVDPDTEPPPTSGGGGGGSFGWSTLLYGACGLLLRRRRRPPASATSQ